MRTDIEVLMLNMIDQTAHCSDGITRSFYQMYDHMAEKTDEPEDAIAVVIQVGDDEYIVCSVPDGASAVH